MKYLEKFEQELRKMLTHGHTDIVNWVKGCVAESYRNGQAQSKGHTPNAAKPKAEESGTAPK